ncbi:MAG: hypothetical protein AAB372_02130 [Patescibacteria group bacterium]
MNDKIEKIFKHLSYATLVSYVVGFLIWSIYLYSLRFVEIDVLQTRFILTGFSFLLSLGVLSALLAILIQILQKGLQITIRPRGDLVAYIKRFQLQYLFCTIILLFILYAYSVLIFPQIPQLYGGGRPRALSVLAYPDQLEFLKAFGVENGASSATQTANYCIAYENNEVMVILLDDRVLQLRKSVTAGIGALPGTALKTVEKELCKPIVAAWLVRGNSLEDSKFARFLFSTFYSIE